MVHCVVLACTAVAHSIISLDLVPRWQSYARHFFDRTATRFRGYRGPFGSELRSCVASSAWRDVCVTHDDSHVYTEQYVCNVCVHVPASKRTLR